MSGLVKSFPKCSNVIFETFLCNRYYYLHFMDKEVRVMELTSITQPVSFRKRSYLPVSGSKRSLSCQCTISFISSPVPLISHCL